MSRGTALFFDFYFGPPPHGSLLAVKQDERNKIVHIMAIVPLHRDFEYRNAASLTMLKMKRDKWVAGRKFIVVANF